MFRQDIFLLIAPMLLMFPTLAASQGLQERSNDDRVEFEEASRSFDVRLSRIFTTPRGNQVRVMVKPDGAVVLLPIGRTSGHVSSIEFTGGLPNSRNFIGDIYDKVLEAGEAAYEVGKKLYDELAQGGNCNVNVKFNNESGGVIIINDLNMETHCGGGNPDA